MLKKQAQNHQDFSNMKPVGMGDVVAAATTAAGIKPCGGCARRQAAMNKATPKWVTKMLRWLRF